jgi:hypothetical protein
LTTTGPTSLNVQWDDRSTDEEAFYVWYWKDRAGLIEDRSAPPRVVPASAGTGRRTITLSGLAPATRYCATIVSGYQKLKSLGPRACQSTDTLPAQPTGLTVAAGSRTTLDLRWTDNATNETGYRVDRQQGSSWVAVATLGANAVSFTHTGLVPGATSCYRVVAINAGGETASATVCGTTDTTPPDLVVVNILELDYKDPTLDAGLLHGGEPFTFGVDLCNIGGADAGKNQTQLDIWDGRSWVSSTTGSVPELPPGGCTRVHVPFANGLAANQYDAYATADSGGGVTESNEANNTFRLSFNILTP